MSSSSPRHAAGGSPPVRRTTLAAGAPNGIAAGIHALASRLHEALFAAAAIAVPALLGAQEPPPQAPDPGWAWILEWDRRVYVPTGLQAISFVFRTGDEAGKEASRETVRYLWRKDHGDRVEFLAEDGSAQATPLSAPPGREAELRTELVAAARNLGRRIRGRSFAEELAGYRGRVLEEVVNGELQTSVVLEPTGPRKIRRTRFWVGRDRLPWRQRIEFVNGDVVVLHLSYEARGERLVPVAVQHHYTPADPADPAWSMAERLTYQPVGPYLLLASVERQSRDLAPWAVGRTEIRQVVVDDEVAAFAADP
jgi:hypothetical protein